MEKVNLDQMSFRWHMNENPMANQKLAEGIRRFSNDIRTLEKYIQGQL